MNLPLEKDLRIIASGLQFPEGPIAMDDGSVLLVELVRQTLSRVSSDGTIDVIAHCGGGPNGAALGPDGRVYICNNGGFDDETDLAGFFANQGMPRGYVGGSIQAVNLNNGTVDTLYTECNGHPLRAPNDIVFDANGGFWFTDMGKSWPRYHDHGSIFYATPDGSSITEVVHPMITPNGVALSPGGQHLVVAETTTGRVYKWDIDSPGKLSAPLGRQPKASLINKQGPPSNFDSLALTVDGTICVATLGSKGGITEIQPNGDQSTFVTGDVITTNICFGGPLMQTAFITCAQTGTLRSTQWNRPGLKLNFQDSLFTP